MTYLKTMFIDYVRKVFKDIHFSEQGSNSRTKEETAYMMFLKYLDHCEKSMHGTVLYNVHVRDIVLYFPFFGSNYR